MSYVYQEDHPPVERYPGAIAKLRPPYLGVDFEWNIRTGIPTVLGVSDGATTVSVPFDSGFRPFLDLIDRFPGAWTFVGHNFVQAERRVLMDQGVSIPLESIEDTIAWHYLTSPHLCKAGSKAAGDENELDVRGGGYMNIWTMCSIWTSAACWKFCKGEANCNGPCPKHDVFGYNGLDALYPVLALKGMIQRARLLGVDKLYPLHRALLEQFDIMRSRGLWVNREYIAKLRYDFVQNKERMWRQDQKEPDEFSLPFNPRSGDQVKNYFFKKYGIQFDDIQEDTIREMAEAYPGNGELQDLRAYKEYGNGPDRWYADRVWNEEKDKWDGYVVDQGGGLGTIHANVGMFTGTGRLNCTNPNLMNIEKRRIDRRTGEKVGEKLREAVVAPPGYNLYSTDMSNGENRVFLKLAGYDIPRDQDLHTWMVGNMGIKETDEFAISLGGARDASKSVTHAQDYLEGLQLKTAAQLRSPRVKAEIAAGARIVFDDWKFKDSFVTFTGSNLARRAFGDASYENRRKALEAGEKYIGKNGAFPKVRELQKSITRQIERGGMVVSPDGYCLLSYDRTSEDRLKTAAAMIGSNPIAHRLKLSLLNLENHPHLLPLLPVHDETLVIADARHDPSKVRAWIAECMEIETAGIPGLIVPTKTKVGQNWRQMSKIE